jgi:formaldehyde-activating enzyme involved in methanogenesis
VNECMNDRDEWYVIYICTYVIIKNKINKKIYKQNKNTKKKCT